MKQKALLITVFFSCILGVYCQSRFKEEVNSIQKKYESLWNKNKETIVFTGSSSIRLWKNIDSLFPNKQIVNSGFGASLSHDLLFYTDELILKYNPTKVFIYEGDNDIAYDKKPIEILHNIEGIITKIRATSPKTEILLISTKPSIRRWHLKNQYKQLNRKLKRLTKTDSKLSYIDVWNPMIRKKNINTSLFVSDGLHMNDKGYAIWYKAIKKHLK